MTVETEFRIPLRNCEGPRYRRCRSRLSKEVAMRGGCGLTRLTACLPSVRVESRPRLSVSHVPVEPFEDHPIGFGAVLRLLDPAEFLSDYGIRSLSKYHERHPFVFGQSEVRYDPAESDNKIKGGNSNWRGAPIASFSASFRSLAALHLEILTLRQQTKLRAANEAVTDDSLPTDCELIPVAAIPSPQRNSMGAARGPGEPRASDASEHHPRGTMAAIVSKDRPSGGISCFNARPYCSSHHPKRQEARVATASRRLKSG